MMRSVLSLSLFLLSTIVFGQIEFFGSPEPIDNLNSSSGENYLYLSSDGNSIYFTRQKHPNNSNSIKDAGDIWNSSLDSAWKVPVRLSTNDQHLATPLGFSQDGSTFFYNKVRKEKGLYIGEVFAITDPNTKKEIRVDIPYFKNISPLQTGSFSYDGRHILISLENSTGYGVDDLYVTHLKADGTWTYPKNLGHKINTRFQEITPFLAPDSKTLIFASNGRDGAGSFDLYMSVRMDDTWQNWSEPVNLGSPVNTQGAETSMMFTGDATYAYYISTQNSDGYGDVKRIKIKADIEEVETESPVAEVMLEEDTSQQQSPDLREITFEFRDAKTGEAIFGEVLVARGSATGEMSDFAPYQGGIEKALTISIGEDEVYDFEFKAKGYLSEEFRVGWEELDPRGETRVITLEPLESGNVITLKNVLFYRGTANFIEGSERELDLVVEMLMENPDIDIFLKGHTDNVGNPALNIQLSQERVRAVKDYLTSQDIDPSRIKGKGYGGSEPIASNENEKTRKLNRRVEFVIQRD